MILILHIWISISLKPDPYIDCTWQASKAYRTSSNLNKKSYDFFVWTVKNWHYYIIILLDMIISKFQNTISFPHPFIRLFSASKIHYLNNLLNLFFFLAFSLEKEWHLNLDCKQVFGSVTLICLRFKVKLLLDEVCYLKYSSR